MPKIRILSVLVALFVTGCARQSAGAEHPPRARQHLAGRGLSTEPAPDETL